MNLQIVHRSTTAKIEGPTRTADLMRLPFKDAALAWLETRKPFIAPRTYQDYSAYIETLALFFGGSKLTEITSDDLRGYQRFRMTRVSVSKINQECGIIQQMLKRIGRWVEVGDDYQPLPLPKSYEAPGRALTDQEYDRLFRTAARRPGWEMAYLFAVISVNTTAGPKEVWTLRRKDVSLDSRTIAIQPEGAKNRRGRVRVIPLNELAFAAIERVLELADERGFREPHYYLFPFRIRGNAYSGTYDPERHCTTCKTAWKQLTIAAGMPGLRPYDMRHTAVTDLLSNPDVSEETAEAIAGHISHAIKKRYSHIRISAKRTALDALLRSNPRKNSSKEEA